MGALISSTVAFVILIVQRLDNNKQQERNRQLQKQIIAYQMRHDNLNDFKKVIGDCYLAYSKNNLIILYDQICSEKKAPYMIKELFEKMNLASLSLESVDYYNRNDEDTKKILDRCRELAVLYSQSLKDIQRLASWYDMSIDAVKEEINNPTSFYSNALKKKLLSDINLIQNVGIDGFIKEMLNYRIKIHDNYHMKMFLSEARSFINREQNRATVAFMSNTNDRY